MNVVQKYVSDSGLEENSELKLYIRDFLLAEECFCLFKWAGSLSNIVTYLLPVVLFFYFRKIENQSPSDAIKYLGIISFYKYLFDLLYTLICVTESLLITITMGERLYQLKLKLISLIEYQLKCFKNKLQLNIRQFNLNLFEMKHMTIRIPPLKLLGMMKKNDDETTNANIILQKNLNLKAEREQCILITGNVYM
ncbi:unnamed protein product [Didymodactylos carnosus]|uniref:Uncharacterized protein n=2 Tax=Didymodactylos carnosus TaxID=1234261 RepID=A0A815CAB1_9BILA|nr:unnamed protein product [Didymodactylos carnosus]CAF4078927.1 unnamed protein product [Didymodactylos carnosus]